MDNNLLSNPEKLYLDNLILSRWNFIYGDAHGIAYVLDPRYMGDGMSSNLRDKIEDFVWSYHSLGAQIEDIEMKDIMFCQYSQFQQTVISLRESQKQNYMYQKLMAGTYTVLEWWKVKTAWPELRKLAIRIFSLVPSGAESERNFSTEGFIHSKLRNRLSSEKVAKLNAIKTNSYAFRDYNLQDVDDIDDAIDESSNADDSDATDAIIS